MSLAAGERKKEMVQIECRWVVFQKVEAATENEQELWPRVWCLVFLLTVYLHMQPMGTLTSHELEFAKHAT